MHRRSLFSLNMRQRHRFLSAFPLREDKFVFEIEYRGDMYNEETIKYLADNLETTADGILREYEPADIRLMFEEETKMEDDPSHAGKTFVDLFREMVQNIRTDRR